MKLTLHTHTREGSWDASLTEREMARVYAEHGIVSAVTDHNTVTRTDRITGIERTVDADAFIHVVEIPEYDFAFLAHPSRLRLGGDTKSVAADLISEYGLDGVEKFSQGIVQYEGHIDGVPELANDDAHNGFQAGLSYMETDADGIGLAIGEIERKGISLHNPSPPRSKWAGKLRQAAELAPKKVRSDIRSSWLR